MCPSSVGADSISNYNVDVVHSTMPQPSKHLVSLRGVASSKQLKKAYSVSPSDASHGSDVLHDLDWTCVLCQPLSHAPLVDLESRSVKISIFESFDN